MRSDAGKIQTFCYAGPALVEWGAPAESASSCGDYDWVAPFTAVASPAWRERFSAWEQDREWRPFLPLPVLLADGKLAAKFAHALKKKADEDLEELNGNLDKEDLYKEVIESAVRLIEDARRLRTESLFVLIPRPELREKPFAKWTAADEATTGY